MKPKKPFVPPAKTGGDSVDQAKVDGLMQFSQDFLEIARLKDEKKRLETDLTELNVRLKEQTDKCIQLLDRTGLKNLPIKGVGLFYRGVSVHPKVIEEGALFADLKKRKMGSLIKNTVHYKTLQSAIKEMKDKGEWAVKPLAGVEVYEEPFVGLRREGAARDTAL